MSLGDAFAKPAAAALAPAPVAVLLPRAAGKDASEAPAQLAGVKRPRSASAASDDAGAGDAPASGAAAPHPTRKERKLKAAAERREDPERLARTAYVGNLPVTTSVKALVKFFGAALQELREAGKLTDEAVAAAPASDAPKEYHHLSKDIESVRFRNIPIAAVAVTPGSSYKDMRRAAFIQGKFAEVGKADDGSVVATMCAYVVFRSKSALDAALTLNGAGFMGHTLRLDAVGEEPVKYDPKRTVFVGNLPWDVTEEEVRALFASRLSDGARAVESVRLVRDKKTSIGKGIAYVLFKERLHVAEALGLTGVVARKREVRIQKCSADGKPLSGMNAKKVTVGRVLGGGAGAAKVAAPSYMGATGEARVKAAEKKALKKKSGKAGGAGGGKDRKGGAFKKGPASGPKKAGGVAGGKRPQGKDGERPAKRAKTSA